MIIIATVGRTGSSVLLEYLSKIGLGAGDVKWIKKFDAGMENPRVSNINHKFRKKLLHGGTLRSQEIQRQIMSLGFDVIKDPQFLVHPDIIKYWIKVRTDIQVIFLTRDSHQVVSSMRRHPEMNTPAFRCFPEKIRDHEDRFLKILNRFKIKYIKLSFPDFLSQKKLIDDTVKRWGYIIKPTDEIWDMVIKPEKVHIW